MRHVVLTGGVLLAAHVAAAPRLAAQRPAVAWAAVVDASYAGPDGALVDRVRTFRTVGAALAVAPAGATNPHIVLVRRGRYHEKLVVAAPNVTLVGESRDSTIVSWDDWADRRRPEGGTLGTRWTATMRIAAPAFRAESLTIENAFDYPANAAKAADDTSKKRNVQGVALMLDQGSDRASFENVRIAGHQDTLFPDAGRAYFHRCVVLGSVDFIFGAGRAVFDDCDIVSRDRGSATNNGYVAAPSTPIGQPYGFVFVDSRLKKERPTMAAGSVALGRPWHPQAEPMVSPSAVYVRCWMDDHVGAKGWEEMAATDASGTRYTYSPLNARFFEYRTTGPGAVATPSRRLLGDGEALAYTISRVLDGWVPPGVAAR